MQILLDYLETSIVGGMIILIYIGITILYGSRFCKRMKKLVWFLIALKLVIPVSFGIDAELFTVKLPNHQISVLSVKNPENTVNLEDQLENEEAVKIAREKIGVVSTTESKILELREPVSSASAIRKPVTTGMVMTVVWIGGTVVFLVYYFVLHFVWCRKTYGNSFVCDNKNVLEIVKISAESLGLSKIPAVRIIRNGTGSPFTVGMWKNTIFLPDEEYAERDLYYILKHELVHCKNRDIWIKCIMLCVNALHWFNPLVWLIRMMMNQDMEMICDEEVIRGGTKEERREYSEVIMACIGAGEKGPAALSTAYIRGIKLIKQRFQNIFDTRKKQKGILCSVCVIFAVFFLSGLVHIEEKQLKSGNLDIDYGTQLKIDLDSDGAVELVTVNDEYRESYAATQLSIVYKNGDCTWIEYPGYWASYMVIGDLTGDGIAEIVLFRRTYGGNVGAGDVDVLYVQEGEFKVYTDTIIQNTALEGMQPISFDSYGEVSESDKETMSAEYYLPASCIGASIVEKDGKMYLRLVYLGDDYYGEANTKDGAKYIDCLYTEEGWYIVDLQEVDDYFSAGRQNEVLDFSFIYE